MPERILMQVSGDVRPLQLSPAGTTLSSGGLARWSGVPLEVHQVGDWEGDASMGPLRGSSGLLVFLGGHVEFLGRRAGRDRAWQSRAGQATLLSGDECPRVLACRGRAQVAAVDFSSDWVRAAVGGEPKVMRATVGLGPQASIAQHVHMLVDHLHDPTAVDPLATESTSLDLLSSVLAALPEARVSARRGRLQPALCRQLRDYVQAHLARSITLSELAALCGCSPRHFSTLFKEAFVLSPYRYVVQARLMEAARLLRTSRRGLAEVAYEVGFSSQSHFSTAFHQAFGVRPREYARHYRPVVMG